MLARYGWPEIPFENMDCTLVRSLALALPPKLEKVAAALELKNQKDPSSQRLMLSMARPRKARARKGEIPGTVYWHDDKPEKIERLDQRCESDVAIEQELDSHLPPLSDAEWKLWQLDFKINYEHGFPIDRQLAEAAQKIVEQAGPEIDAEVCRLTDGAVDTINQVKGLLPWVQGHGYRGLSLTRDVVEQQLAQNTDIDADARRVLDLRLASGSAAKKPAALLARAGKDDRIYGAFQFHKASTGRWAGEGLQPQNLKRSPKNIEAALEAISSGSLKRLKKFSPTPLVTIGEAVRAMIRAKDGYELIRSDLNAIEPRCAAFVAGENWLVDAFAKFDASQNPAHEPYRILASQIFRVSPDKVTDEQRQLAKIAFLAFMYAGGLGAWRNFLPDTCTDEEVLRIRDSWRKLHPNIFKFWYASIAAPLPVKQPGRASSLRHDRSVVHGHFLFLELPSKRQLAYPFPSIVRNNFD